MAKGVKPGQPAAFGFIGVDGKLFKVSSAGVGHMVGAPGNRPSGPLIVNVERQRCVNPDLRMQTVWRLPGSVSHAADRLSLPSGWYHGHAFAIADNDITVFS